MNTSFENFDKNGFVLFKNVLTPEEVAIFRGECERIVEQEKIISQGDNDYLRNNILVRSDIVRDIFLQEKVINVIKKICGDDFCILPEVSIMRSQYGGWHKDTTSVEIFGYDFHKTPDFRVVNVAIYCQDNGDYGGGLDVVPGSHKIVDSFVEYYRKQENDALNKKEPVISSIVAIKTAIKDFLKTSKILPEKYFKKSTKNKVSYPLDVNDTKDGKYKIPSKIGDIVIFDLRMDHKASWPKSEFDPLSVPTKYAFFAICGANNDATVSYKNYLLKRSETQDSYKYLLDYEIPSTIREFADKNKINIL